MFSEYTLSIYTYIRNSSSFIFKWAKIKLHEPFYRNFEKQGQLQKNSDFNI